MAPKRPSGGRQQAEAPQSPPEGPPAPDPTVPAALRGELLPRRMPGTFAEAFAGIRFGVHTEPTVVYDALASGIDPTTSRTTSRSPATPDSWHLPPQPPAPAPGVRNVGPTLRCPRPGGRAGPQLHRAAHRAPSDQQPACCPRGEPRGRRLDATGSPQVGTWPPPPHPDRQGKGSRDPLSMSDRQAPGGVLFDTSLFRGRRRALYSGGHGRPAPRGHRTPPLQRPRSGRVTWPGRTANRAAAAAPWTSSPAPAKPTSPRVLPLPATSTDPLRKAPTSARSAAVAAGTTTAAAAVRTVVPVVWMVVVSTACELARLPKEGTAPAGRSQRGRSVCPATRGRQGLWPGFSHPAPSVRHRAGRLTPVRASASCRPPAARCRRTAPG
jgi:hypothetical protein